MSEDQEQPEPVAPSDEPERMELDAWSFNAAERHECQVQFDTEFGDLLEYVYKVVRPAARWVPQQQVDEAGNTTVVPPTGPLTVGIIDRAGRRWFGDEILAFMCWVQAKRTRPDAELAEFGDVMLTDLTSAHIAGLLKKATGATGSSRQRRSGSR